MILYQILFTGNTNDDAALFSSSSLASSNLAEESKTLQAGEFDINKVRKAKTSLTSTDKQKSVSFPMDTSRE